MSESRPKFMDSPYFVDEPGNWHLKEGAPKEIVKELEHYIKSSEETDPIHDRFHLNDNGKETL
jgi:hypothetical protein